MPVVFLRLAGVYDILTSVPTFANQIARIYERDLQSHVYAGDNDAGQTLVHRDDMIDAFVRTVDRRAELTGETAILIGEEEAIGYADPQGRLGQLIHGEEEWPKIRANNPLLAISDVLSSPCSYQMVLSSTGHAIITFRCQLHGTVALRDQGHFGGGCLHRKHRQRLWLTRLRK